MTNSLDYKDIMFAVSKNDISKIEKKNNIFPSMYFVTKIS